MRNDGQIFYLPSAMIIVEKNPKWQDPIFNLMFDGEENVAEIHCWSLETLFTCPLRPLAHLLVDC